MRHKEIWKPIFKGLYAASSLGRIKRIKTRGGNPTEHFIKPMITHDGYERISISIKGIIKNYTVHVLVALAFLGKRPKGKVVNHINGIKRDNRVSNFEYITVAQNQIHSAKMNLIAFGERASNTTLKEKEVLEIRRLLKEGELSIPKIAEKFRVTPCPIYHIRDGLSWWRLK